MDAERVEPVLVEGRIRIPYRWPSGRNGDRFLAALRDEARWLGLRCARTGRVVVPPPPRPPGPEPADADWVEVGPSGTVSAWTVARSASPPVIYALVRLDGADTAVLHRLLDVAPEAVRRGMRVESVFARERAGSIADVAGFRPAGGAR